MACRTNRPFIGTAAQNFAFSPKTPTPLAVSCTAPTPHTVVFSLGVVYLNPADKYHRLTRRLSQRAKRPKRESSHGLSPALSPLVTPSRPAVRTHVAGSGSLSLPLPPTVACSSPH